MKPPHPMVTAMSHNEDSMIHFAARYALGRRTSAPHIVCQELKRHWKTIKPSTRNLIQKEIREAIKDNNAGCDYHIAEWEAILQLPTHNE